MGPSIVPDVESALTTGGPEAVAHLTKILKSGTGPWL